VAKALAARAPLPGPITVGEVFRRRLVRLAFDVHDGPMQNLTAVGYSIQQLRRRLKDGQELDVESVALELDQILAQLLGSESGLRALISNLESTDPEIDTLDEILDGEIEAFARRGSARLDVSAPRNFQFDSHSQAVAIRSVLREALTNVTNHAGAEHVQIRVEASPAGILLEIEDDGQGFDPGCVRDDALGLAGMRHRVDLLGGDFDVLSRPGGPTVVTARFKRWRAP
jgi:two-component system, NarL family, sensor histidine kinase DegS